MKHRKLVVATVTLLVVAYPLLVFFGLQKIGMTNLAIILMALFILRLMVIVEKKKPIHYLSVAAIIVGGACLLLTDNAELMLYYPVVISLMVAVLFFLSLAQEKTIIEKTAERFKTSISDLQRRYMRALTKIWVLVLILNAFAAGYTACCTSVNTWAFYNGFLSYVLMGAFMGAEFIFRCYFKWRYEGGDENDG